MVLRVTNNGSNNNNNEDEVRVVGTYKGHNDDVMGVVKGDSDRFSAEFFFFFKYFNK